jgi:ATP-binding cassette subfamily F protein uup
VTGTLVFEGDGRVTEYSGGYEDWIRQRPSPTASAPVEKATAAPAKVPAKSAKPKKFLNRDQRELADLPAELEKLEAERDILARRLEDPALYQKSHDILRTARDQVAALEKTIAERYARWEELETLRDSLSAE